MVNLRLRTINEAADFKTWKRKNVTVRGIKETGEDNGVFGGMGKGLYSCPLSNKAMAKTYGELKYLVNARPKKPIVFQNRNTFEIWFQKLQMDVLGIDFPSERKWFESGHTIEEEVLKMGYDGLEVKGREMVNFAPKDVLYFGNERQLETWYDDNKDEIDA